MFLSKCGTLFRTRSQAADRRVLWRVQKCRTYKNNRIYQRGRRRASRLSTRQWRWSGGGLLRPARRMYYVAAGWSALAWYDSYVRPARKTPAPAAPAADRLAVPGVENQKTRRGKRRLEERRKETKGEEGRGEDGRGGEGEGRRRPERRGPVTCPGASFEAEWVLGGEGEEENFRYSSRYCSYNRSLVVPI